VSDFSYYTRLKPHTSEPLRKALLQLVMMQPFWGILALHMDFVPDDKLPTMCTDGKRVYYSPKFVDSLTTAKLVFAIAHECGHPMLHHLSRRYNRLPGDTDQYGNDEFGKPFGVNPKGWNIAGDYVINAMLKESGFSLWEQCLYEPRYAGLTTEQIYLKLKKDNPPPPPSGKGSGDMRSGQGQSQGDNPGEPDASDDGTDPFNGGVPGEDSTQQAGRKPGGPGATDTSGQSDNGGDLRAPAEDHTEQEWNEIVTKAAAIAKGQGKLPAGIAGMIAEATEPQYPFYLVLEQFVDSCINQDDYSWHKPHRDYFSRGIIMPGPYSENIDHVVVIFDTSGSVSDDDLTRFARITGDIMRRLKPANLTLIMCDADVDEKSVTKITNYKDWPKEVKTTGRGGTSFVPPFDYIAKARIKPSCVVYMTDMHGDFPDHKPMFPMFWASTSKGEIAPFGQTVYINQ